MEREVKFLGKLLGDVERPFVAIIGGAKVSDKIGVLDNLLERVDQMLIGGAMANTFLKAKGGQLGRSLVEEDKLPLARSFLKKAEEANVDVLLPRDAVAAAGIKAESGRVVQAMVVPEDLAALDIGPETARGFADAIARAKTIFWNGPMGVFESAPFAGGTMAVAKAVAGAQGALSVVGGGDSVAAIHQSGLGDKIDPYLHRRRRFVGIPGGEEAPRPGGARTGLEGSWRGSDGAHTATVFLRELEAQRHDCRIAGAGHRRAQRRGDDSRRRRRRGPQLHRALRRGQAPRGRPGDRGGAGLLLGREGGVHRRGGPLADRRRRLQAGHRRPLRATPAVRRQLDAAVNLKARAALRAGLGPIVCIGETLAERDAGETLGRIAAQLDAALADMTDGELERIVIAYEPVWAIGTGRNATPAQAQEVHHFIRSRLATRAPSLAPRLRILYGGSVKPDNIRALMAEADVDGGLVGGASLSAESFIRIVKEGMKEGSAA